MSKHRWIRPFVRPLTIILMAVMSLTNVAHPAAAGMVDPRQFPARPLNVPSDAELRKAALAQLKLIDPTEIVDLRRADREYLRTGHGYKVNIHAEPQYYQKLPGVFDHIDNSIVPVTDVASIFRFENKANALKAQFTDNPGHNQVHLGYQDRSFTFDLDEDTGEGVPGYHVSAGQNDVTYHAPGSPVSLNYALGAQSVKETIKLERYTGKNTWSFALHLQGLVATQYDDGHIGLNWAQSISDQLFGIDPVTAVDAAGVKQQGTLGLVSRPDGTYSVEVSVPKSWLTAAERKYPVVIDPSVQLASNSGSSMFGTIQNGNVTPISGTDMELKGDGSMRGLVKWDFRGIASQETGSPFTIVYNQLSWAPTSIYRNSAYCPGTNCTASLHIYPLAQDWYTQSATWTRPRWTGTSWNGGDICTTTSCPGLTTDALQSYCPNNSCLPIATNTSGQDPNNFYLEKTIRPMLAGTVPNYGFLFQLEDQPPTSGPSDLHIYPPSIGLEFDGDHTPPSVSIQSVTPNTQGQTSLYGPLTINVNASDTMDSNAAAVIGRVELYVDDVLAGSATAVNSSGYYVFNINTQNYLAGHHRLFARAYDVAGNHNDSSMTDVTFQGGLITPPANVTVTPTSSTSYQLSWAPSLGMRPTSSSSPVAVTYNVYRATSATANPATLTPINSAPITSTSYPDTPGSGTFYYWVVATNTLDGARSAFSAAATAQNPVPPWGLVAGQSGNSVALSWQPSPNAFTDSGITYKVSRSTAGGAASVVASGLTNTTWTDTSVVSATNYTYQVSAVNRGTQESALTAAYSITAGTGGGPDAPTGVQAVTGRNRATTVSWNAVGGSTTYNVYRSADRSVWTQIATGLTGWFYNDYNLSEGTTYYYQVQAVSGSNAGPRSATAGAMAVAARRLGIDSRFPVTSSSMGDSAAYLNLNNGNLTLAASDSVVTAPYLPVVIRRTYNSQGAATGSLGNWRLNADWNIEDFGSYVILTAADGTEHMYTVDAAGNYHGDDRWYWSLVKNGSGYLVTRPDRIQYTFNSQGQITTISERNGNTITYNYDLTGTLTGITDPVGRNTTFTRDGQGRITAVTDSASRITQYGYDAGNRLTSVTDAEGRIATYQYDSAGRLTYTADPSGAWSAVAYDDSGRVAALTDPLGEATTIAYSTSGSGGGSTLVTDPLQATTAFVTDYHGNLTSLTDAYQYAQVSPRSWQYNYTYMATDTAKLQTLAVTNPLGVVTTVTYDTTGNVTQVQDTGTDLTAPGVTSRAASFSYLSNSSDLNQATDYMSYTSTNTYSTTAPIRLITTADPLGNQVQRTYGSFGLPTAITDARSNQSQFAYDTYGNLSTITYPMGGTKNLVKSFTYNADGSVMTASELHDSAASSIPATRYEYDNLGRRLHAEYPDGSMEGAIYDPSGRVGLQVGRGGQAQSYSYDAAGRLAVVTDTTGHTTTYTYDRAGNLTQLTDANGHTSTATYDQLHRVTRRQSATGMTMLYRYDAMGHVTDVTSGDQSIVGTNGYQVTASYYASGLPHQISEPLRSDSVLLSSGAAAGTNTTVNNIQTFVYNLAGKSTQVTDGTGQVTSYGYDKDYHLLQVTDANSGNTQYAYDQNGNRTRVTDALGHSTQYAYDVRNRLASVTDPLGVATTYAYDDAGNQASRTEQRFSGSMTAAAAVTTSYGYDLGHHLTTITYPNAAGQGPLTPVNFLYDGAGRRLYRRDDFGVSYYSYDALGRLSKVFGPQENVAYTYDAVGNRTGVKYSLGQVTYAYDSGNRLQSVADPLGNTSTYSYDNYGHVSQIALPNGVTRRYGYWALPNNGPVTNRLQSLSTTNSSTNFWTGNYQQDYVGNVRNTNVSWNQTPSLYSLTATYDNLYRLTQWTDTSPADSSIRTNYFAYDAVGNRLTWGNLNNTGTNNFKTPPTWRGSTTPTQTPLVNNQSATYNSANRLSWQNWSEADNWMQQSPISSTGVQQEPNGNAMLEQYTYGMNTSTTPQGMYAKLQYTFNDADQLQHYHSELNDPGISTNPNAVMGFKDDETYHYDGDGRRLDWSMSYTHGYWNGGAAYYPSSLVTTKTDFRRYEYVGSDVVSEQLQGGAVTVWYVYAGGEKLYTVHWSTTSSNLTADVYAKDHLGSIRQVINSSGQTANSYNYDAFGLPTIQTVQLSNSYQFAASGLDGTQYLDAGTNTYHWANSFYNLRARVYNPQSGRFLTQDTYLGSPWAPWTQNLYSYVGNNPVNLTDPTGHCPWCAVIGAVVGAVYGAIDSYATTGSVDWGQVGQDALYGAVIGFTGGAVLAEAAVFGGMAAAAVGIEAGADVAGIGLAALGLNTAVAIAEQQAAPSVAPAEPVPVEPAPAPVAPVPVATPSTQSSPTTAPQAQTQAPDFVATPGGTAVAIPKGATGPLPVNNGKGFQYVGGATRAPNGSVISDVRIMDPTKPTASSPGYPNGYAVYHNQYGQPVSPQSGQTLPRTSFHIPF